MMLNYCVISNSTNRRIKTKNAGTNAAKMAQIGNLLLTPKGQIIQPRFGMVVEKESGMSNC
uniref:Uncharacterized protein n=1 Tax=Romanomermis culicivorax TaxID=13658 RepID=A0A915IKF7_ROMCU